MPISRMQWWIRPGPSRAWAIAKPPPSSPIRFAAGHPDVVEHDLGVAAVVVVLVAEHLHAAPDLDAGGVARHQDHRLLAADVGAVRVGLAHHDEDLAVAGSSPRRCTTCGR